jgi:hypothetical protein
MGRQRDRRREAEVVGENPSGAWRGSVNEGASVGTPGVEHAAESRGDSGKAGISGKVAAAAGVAAAAAAATAATAGGKSPDAAPAAGVPITPVATPPIAGNPGQH